MERIAVGKSHVGMIRANNEDSIFISNENIGFLPNLFIVADGMGGHNAGEVASTKAIEFFEKHILEIGINDNDTNIILNDAIRYANEQVYELSIQNDNLIGMGTTFTVCTVKHNILYFGHVGDSRMYIISDDNIRLISEDHTFVNEMIKTGQLTYEEAKIHPNRNMIMRALGTERDILIDYGLCELSQNEVVLLCTDGLTNMIHDEDIFTIVKENSDKQSSIDKLIQTANENGGKDNISAILI